METVFKYALAVTDRQSLLLPKGALALIVQVQREQPCLWCQVDSTAALEERRFAIVGTGYPLPTAEEGFAQYIGTFQQYDGDLIWHVFELVPWLLVDTPVEER